MANQTNAILLCTDGSDLSIAALRSGLDLLGSPIEVTLVTAIARPDPSLVTGSGIAGGMMSDSEFVEHEAERSDEAKRVLAETGQALGLEHVGGVVLEGSPGPAICAHAEEVSARAIVIGNRGRSGVKRAVLGSVSDHVVRNAPCPVVVVGQSD